VAIIVAILVFGGLWGFWGVFFAIPLATLVQAVLKAWPRNSMEGDRSGEAPEKADITAN
jgi:putative permease